jgi:hypothetical protein
MTEIDPGLRREDDKGRPKVNLLIEPQHWRSFIGFLG